MVDADAKRELETQIASSKSQLHALKCCEEELLQHIPSKGFKAAAARATMHAKADALCNSIRTMEQRLKAKRRGIHLPRFRVID